MPSISCQHWEQYTRISLYYLGESCDCHEDQESTEQARIITNDFSLAEKESSKNKRTGQVPEPDPVHKYIYIIKAKENKIFSSVFTYARLSRFGLCRVRSKKVYHEIYSFRLLSYYFQIFVHL
jgi:hypothetical protein